MKISLETAQRKQTAAERIQDEIQSLLDISIRETKELKSQSAIDKALIRDKINLLKDAGEARDRAEAASDRTAKELAMARDEILTLEASNGRERSQSRNIANNLVALANSLRRGPLTHRGAPSNED